MTHIDDFDSGSLYFHKQIHHSFFSLWPWIHISRSENINYSLVHLYLL